MRAETTTSVEWRDRYPRKQEVSSYTTDSGAIFIENSNGKVIMNGWINRTGGVTLYYTISDDNYVGIVNPMGNGLLMSPKTCDTIRVEVQS